MVGLGGGAMQCKMGKRCEMGWGKHTKSEIWGKLVPWLKVNTGELNMNDKQESKHKVHLRGNYSKCLTTWHDDSWLVRPQEGAHWVAKNINVMCELQIICPSNKQSWSDRVKDKGFNKGDALHEVVSAGCMVVDQQCRESNRKVKINGYMAVSNE